MLETLKLIWKMASNLSHTHLPSSSIASFSIFGYFAETVVTDATNKKCEYWWRFYCSIKPLFDMITQQFLLYLSALCHLALTLPWQCFDSSIHWFLFSLNSIRQEAILLLNQIKFTFCRQTSKIILELLISSSARSILEA